MNTVCVSGCFLMCVIVLYVDDEGHEHPGTHRGKEVALPSRGREYQGTLLIKDTINISNGNLY